MRLKASAVILAIATGCMPALAQDASDQQLARLLANDVTRQGAVARILGPGGEKAPLLLLWAHNPPAQVDKYELFVGLADAFGQLKTKQAIPFLIKNISIDRTRAVNTWLKTPEVIEERLAAVAALVRIGPEASRALIHASWGPMVPEDRLAAIFAISRIKGVPESREFLSSALAQANMERYWLEDGLKLFDARR
jgi:HEAT repeat protein